MISRHFNAYVDGLILVYFSDVKNSSVGSTWVPKRANNKGWNTITFFAKCMLLTSHVCIKT